MPRKSSDSYVTHRIELGKYERDLLSGTVIPTYQVSSIGNALPYIAIGGCCIAITWASVWALYTIYGFKEEAKAELNKWVDPIKGAGGYYKDGEFIPEGWWKANPLAWLGNILIPNREPLPQPADGSERPSANPFTWGT